MHIYFTYKYNANKDNQLFIYTTLHVDMKGVDWWMLNAFKRR
jgi:hypothetical protein